MAKQSGYMQRLQAASDARTRRLLHLAEGFIQQLMVDIFALEMRRHGVSKAKIFEICRATEDTYLDFAAKWQGEISVKSDPDKKSGVRGELQRELEAAFGADCMPWEERYKGLEDAWDLCYQSKSFVERMGQP